MISDRLVARLKDFADSPVGCACFNVQRASRAISQFYDEALSEVGLRTNQYTLLIAVAVGGDLGIGAMAERLVTDRTTLTRNVATLVEMGLVEERRGRDKRLRALGLTRKGRRTLEAALPIWESVQERMRVQLGDGGMRELRKLSDQVVDLVHPDFEGKMEALQGRMKA